MNRKAIIFFMLVCLFITAIFFLETRSTFAQAAGNEIIFYGSDPGHRSQIYSIKPDGTEQVNLSGDPQSWYLYPSWSPDGTKILYSSIERLWMMNADGSNRVQLTFTGAGRLSVPVWSPDGRSIAYVHDGNGFQAAAIYVIDSNGSNLRWLTDIGPHDSTGWIWHFGIDWSPDSSKIVFTRLEPVSRRANIYSINADGSGEVALTQAAVSEFNINPSWSPDGSRIAFSAPTGPENLVATDIFVMDADGSNRRQITNLSTYAMHPSWSPDGRQIVFTANRGFDPPFNIHVMNADGTDIVRVTHSLYGGDRKAPRWRRLPESIIFGRVVTDEGVGLRNAVVMLTSSSGVRTVTTSSLGYFHFDNVTTRETYTLGAKSKRFRFQTQALTVNDSLTDLLLVGFE